MTCWRTRPHRRRGRNGWGIARVPSDTAVRRTRNTPRADRTADYATQSAPITFVQIAARDLDVAPVLFVLRQFQFFLEQSLNVWAQLRIAPAIPGCFLRTRSDTIARGL